MSTVRTCLVPGHCVTRVIASIQQCTMPSRLNTTAALSTMNEESETPAGPHGPPSDLAWRRQRLLRIGNEAPEVGETAALRPSPARATSYGTVAGLPAHEGSRGRNMSSLGTRRGLSAIPRIRIPLYSKSTPASPRSAFSHKDSYFATQRPISAYDKPPTSESDSADGNADVKTNGIRVWYSSFSSIDWLHDAIKDQARQARLRKRRSRRGRIIRQLDRSIGWIIVTIVGFLTALVAFSVVRSEQWLFDIKEGYCRDDWTKAKRFCCRIKDDTLYSSPEPLFLSLNAEDDCDAWRTWTQVFGALIEQNGEWMGLEAEMAQYVAYAVIAVGSSRTRCINRQLTKGHIAHLGSGFGAADNPPHSVKLFHHAQRLRGTCARLRGRP